ncbi:MAG: Eco57I restriction-modification methylase domain-containing protein [Actinomycetota bacterium]
MSAIRWAATTDAAFDVAVGNPPFVRFQFVSDDDRRSMRRLEERLTLSFAGVSNLWLPVLLGTLSRLSIGGAFAFIVPAECFTGISAGVLRQWVVANATELRFDLFPPGSFPAVLQEVVVMSGRRSAPTAGARECEIYEHARAASTAHLIPPTPHPWTRYLLSKSEIEAFDEATHLADVWTLGNVAKFEVAAVTGANDYFSVDSCTLDEFELRPWSVPLLPRIRHAPGLRYADADHASAEAIGAKTHLLDFASNRPDPSAQPRPAAYLAVGEQAELPSRYKCRIRSPWYRVPLIRSGRLMMSKRSHFHPRVVLNDVGAMTTDTIYRGEMVGFFGGREDDLVAAFHNSLTLLSAEVEGRSFGGGVLELVPSEVARLLVPLPQQFGAELDRLDAIARGAADDGAALIQETDLLLVKADIGVTPELLDRLRGGRESLMQRRLDRNASACS